LPSRANWMPAMPHGSVGGSRRRSVGGSPAPAAYLGSPPLSSPPRVCRGHHAPEWGSRAAAYRSSPRTVCWCWRLQLARLAGRCSSACLLASSILRPQPTYTTLASVLHTSPRFIVLWPVKFVCETFSFSFSLPPLYFHVSTGYCFKIEWCFDNAFLKNSCAIWLLFWI
jgi:hypothetical protein